jgi:predicted RNA-binding protein (virulence factor B family)
MENGKINKLDIVRKDQKGFYLQDEKGQEIFLPREEAGLDLEV